MSQVAERFRAYTKTVHERTGLPECRYPECCIAVACREMHNDVCSRLTAIYAAATPEERAIARFRDGWSA